jgi:outer membrane protein TolC
MTRIPLAAVLLAASIGGGCHSYAPAPVDLVEHVRAFAARVPDQLAPLTGATVAPAGDTFDLADGIGRQEARLLALWFHPDCRNARLQAGVTAAVRDEAGRWVDPTLQLYAANFPSGFPYDWLLQAQVAFTIPLSGRLQLERDLASAEHAARLVEARAVEAAVVNRTDAAWARWTATLQQRELLQQLGQDLQALEAIALRLAAAGELTQQEARAFTLERLLRAAELAQADNTTAAAELELKRLLGLHPAAAVRFVPDLSPALLHADASTRQQQVLAGPRLAVLQQRHATAEQSLALAVRKQWPDLVLAPGWQEEEDSSAVALGVNLPLPLWNANIQAIRRAEAERAAAAEALRGAVETTLHDLAIAELQLAAARQQLDLVRRELVPLAQQQVADSRRLAELGQLEPLLILDALVRTYGASTQALAAALAAAEATVAINSLFWNELPAADGGGESR